MPGAVLAPVIVTSRLEVGTIRLLIVKEATGTALARARKQGRVIFGPPCPALGIRTVPPSPEEVPEHSTRTGEAGGLQARG